MFPIATTAPIPDAILNFLPPGLVQGTIDIPRSILNSRTQRRLRQLKNKHKKALDACLNAFRQQTNTRDETRSHSATGASYADGKSEGVETAEIQHFLRAFGRIDGGRVLVNMRAKLLTEVRWIVYGHLLDDEPPERLIHKPLDDLSLEPFNESAGLWWDTDVVGEPDVKHIVEMYLERTYLRFHTNYALGQLIRSADPWKCGLSAGNIRLDVEFTILINQGHEENCTEEDMMNWPLVVREKKVLRDLEALFGFKKGTRLTLEVHDVAAEKRKGLFTERSHLHLLIQMSVLPLIFDTLTRLSRHGYRLRLATYAARDKKSYFDVPVYGGMDKVLNMETEEHIGSLQALQNGFHEHFLAAKMAAE